VPCLACFSTLSHGVLNVNWAQASSGAHSRASALLELSVCGRTGEINGKAMKCCGGELLGTQ
jgi:hypothetical protein